MGAVAVLGILALVVAALLPAALLLATRAPVARSRVARFARRQRLEITPDNGNQIIAYLTTTRRWRVAGVLAAYLLGLGWLAYHVWTRQSGEWATLLTLLSGWFAGAVAAEARLARHPSSPHRSASLRPRDPAAYLSRPARLALPAALAASLAIGGMTWYATLAGRSPDLPTAVLAQLGAVTVAGTVLAVRRRVLTRPQPADLAPDRRAADDAIRSRSLHVLAGAGATLVLYATNYQLQALRAAYPAAASDIEGLTLLLTIGAPVLGWLVAVTPWEVDRRPEPDRPPPARSAS